MKGKCLAALFLLLLLIPLVARLGSSVDSEVHDVAVTQVVAWPNLTLPSYVHVNVTVENQGTGYETFNVTLHADNLTVTSATVADLAPGSKETLKFRCDMFPFRADIFQLELIEWYSWPMVVNVTMWAEASVVAGEVDTADNVYINGTISIIWWIRDLNGDGRIDIVDVAIIARAFGDGGGWHPLWDFDQNGKVDIIDLAMEAKDFGKVYFELPDLDDP